MNSKPVVYWILQKNHVTPLNLRFFKLLHTGIPSIDIRFLIPEMWKETLEEARDINPVPFQAVIHQLDDYKWFCRKRDAISDVKFKDGLPLWRTLVLDDLNAGCVTPVTPNLPENPKPRFIILQIPIPLGSFEHEERLFYAVVHWAHLKKIPVIGYELLPFDTKWTLVQSLLDGVITTDEKSYHHLTTPSTGIKSKVWLLPLYESNFFSVTPVPFWQNSLAVPYNFQNQYKIPDHVAVFHIPHNVALSHEYKRLVAALSRYGKKIHLMFSIGKDQSRGTHTHEQLVRLLSRDVLDRFFSFSFHDLNVPWDMSAADGIIACSSCHYTSISSKHLIPTLIVDPDVPRVSQGPLEIVHSLSEIDSFVSRAISSHQQRKKLADIFMEIISATANKFISG